MSISLFGSNATLSYSGNEARIKVTELNYSYEINAEESQGSYDRAFYPHRRSQGMFSLFVDCNGRSEYLVLMNWLKGYLKAVKASAQTSSQPPTISVSVPSRSFSRVGIFTAGLDNSNHVGAMVYRRELVFISISDPNDATTSILKSSQVSSFQGATYDPATSAFFYPSSNTKATKEQILYDVPSGPTTLPNPNQGGREEAGF